MQTWIITLLIALGLSISTEQWNNMSATEKQNIIIGVDIYN